MFYLLKHRLLVSLRVLLSVTSLRKTFFSFWTVSTSLLLGGMHAGGGLPGTWRSFSSTTYFPRGVLGTDLPLGHLIEE